MKPILEVQNLWKSFRIGAKQERYLSLRDSLFSFAKKGWQRKETFWALQDLNFQVYPGDTLGIIGRNGAGKTTLLKILSRITPPSKGKITVRGRLASLLEVGTGFHPELSGRENIFLNGAILGLKRQEIKRQFDAIVDFSGVEQFLETPLKHYSSGMQLRLAFAVAAHLEPEILLIDEVLAVGDAEFQRRCLGKMDEVAKSGRTVLFVSHDLSAVKALCKHSMLVKNGKIEKLADTESVVDYYLDDFSVKNLTTATFNNDIESENAIAIMSAEILNEHDLPCTSFDVYSDIRLKITSIVREEISSSILNLELYRNGVPLAVSFDTDLQKELLKVRQAGHYESNVTIRGGTLKPGDYSLSIGSGIVNSHKIEHHHHCLAFRVECLSVEESFASFARKRNGVIALPLNWETKSIIEKLSGY